MSITRQEILDILIKLDDRVLEIDLAHGKMVDSMLDALTISKEIGQRVSRKWFKAVQDHKKLGSEIRQLLSELNEIRHQVLAGVQSEKSKSLSLNL